MPRAILSPDVELAFRRMAMNDDDEPATITKVERRGLGLVLTEYDRLVRDVADLRARLTKSESHVCAGTE